MHSQVFTEKEILSLKPNQQTHHYHIATANNTNNSDVVPTILGQVP
jgi:hypothetical protein